MKRGDVLLLALAMAIAIIFIGTIFFIPFIGSILGITVVIAPLINPSIFPL